MPRVGASADHEYSPVSTAIGLSDLPTYVVPGEDLAHGSSLGNAGCWLTTKSTGAIESVFCMETGRDVFGACLLSYSETGPRLIGPQRGSIQDGSRSRIREQSYVELTPDSSGSFEINPVYQKRTFTLPGGLEVEETVFLPMVGPGSATPTVCVGVHLRNRSGEARKLRVYAFAELLGEEAKPDVRYDPALNGLVVRNGDRPGWARLVTFDRAPTAYESVTDRNLVYDPYEKRPLSNRTEASGDVIAALQLDLDLPAHGTDSFGWLLCFSNQGVDRASEVLHNVVDWETVLHQSTDWCSEALSLSRVMAPDREIGEGVLWAKANMLRVMARYPTGAGFTNDPGRSSNVVVRDVAWFVYGCDYLMPEYSAELLRTVAKYQQESGKIVEYWNGRTGETDDYGLNINDDTPLFVLAAGHHFLTTHDMAFARDIYPAVSRAARYMLDQRDDRGLVFCASTETGERGICGWRNVIPGYALSGAVTEVNSECYAALRIAAEMARALGNRSDFAYFVDEAEDLRSAINTHLLNRDNGLYYLNVDPLGEAHSDVTSDQLFPVMFGVSDQETSFRIISRLTRPDFWTAAGLRTASSNSPEYAPDREWGLRGGVWPGVSFWYAFASARYYPEAMVRALASYRHYNEDPLRYNTVPGQFSEWFDGESLANRGMRLSPWEPPRLLWAAMEGLLGVAHSVGGCAVQPLVPDHWKWLAVRDMPHASGRTTMFLARQEGQLHLYGSGPGLSTDLPHEGYERDVSGSVRAADPNAHPVALRRQDELLVCVGSSADVTITVPLDLGDLLPEDLWYYLEIYDSELQDWVKGIMRPASELRQVAAAVEAKGFRLFRLVPIRL